MNIVRPPQPPQAARTALPLPASDLGSVAPRPPQQPSSKQPLLPQTQKFLGSQTQRFLSSPPPPLQSPQTQKQVFSKQLLPLHGPGHPTAQSPQIQQPGSKQLPPLHGPGHPTAQPPQTQQQVFSKQLLPLHGPGHPTAQPPQTQLAGSKHPRSLDALGGPAQQALRAVNEIQRLLDALASSDNISLPDIAAAVCCATNRVTSPSTTPDPIGRSDDPRAVFANSPFSACPPGPWATARSPGDPYPGPICSCGAQKCTGRGHFPVIDATGTYDMHVEFACNAHRRDQAGNFLTPEAHASCYIHTLCTLLSGVWVPFQEGQEPTVQQRAHPITLEPDSALGKAATAAIQDGLARHFFEPVANPADFTECAIIESGFMILKGKLALSPPETTVLSNPQADPRQVASLAKQRAISFWTELRSRTSRSAKRRPRATFTTAWNETGGATKPRLCVAHDVILNPRCHSWSLRYMAASAFLESAQPGDVGITTDHVSGYSGILIHPAFRRFFCFTDPCTGLVYRCTRLDFGWLLSPGIFSFFTAEVNSILNARLKRLSTRAFSGYFIDDNIVRIPGSTLLDAEGIRVPSQLEHDAVAILANVALRAGYLIAAHKRMWAPIVIFIGLTLDPARRSASLVPEKLFKILTMLHVILIAAHATASNSEPPPAFFKRVVGGLQWLAGNVAGGSLYTAPIWLASHLLDIGRIRSVRSCESAMTCLQWWSDSAAAGSLKSHVFVRGIDLPSFRVALSHTAAVGAEAALFTAHQRAGSTRQLLSLLSDASGNRGWGAVWSSSTSKTAFATYAQLTKEQLLWISIEPKELLAWTLWIEDFGPEYAGSLLLLGSDNISNVHCTNRRRIKADDPLSRALLIRLFQAAALHNIDCIAWWCPRELNGIADGLSKSSHVSHARRIAAAHGLTFRDPAPRNDPGTSSTDTARK